ncbi:hypothetical protein ACWGE1_07005 [Streptomyces sp. NPDC054932]
MSQKVSCQRAAFAYRTGSDAGRSRPIAEWTATKLRGGLAVDKSERDRLLDIAAGCGGTDVEFTPAP